MTRLTAPRSLFHYALLSPDPPDEAVGRILNALRAGRLEHAATLLHQLSSVDARNPAWKPYLQVRILMGQGDLVRAKSVAQHAGATAIKLAIGDPINVPDLRLAAAALELEGAALRRQDQTEKAQRIDLAAFQLRQEYGTQEEQCESAFSLGACAEWMSNFAAAERWYRDALHFCTKPEHTEQQSSVLIRLSALFIKLSRTEEALEAAQSAQKLLDDQRPGEHVSLAARLHTAQTLIRKVENLIGESSHSAVSIHEEVANLLKATREDLLAFGPAAHADLAWCDEQLAFLYRLRQMLPPVA